MEQLPPPPPLLIVHLFLLLLLMLQFNPLLLLHLLHGMLSPGPPGNNTFTSCIATHVLASHKYIVHIPIYLCVVLVMCGMLLMHNVSWPQKTWH